VRISEKLQIHTTTMEKRQSSAGSGEAKGWRGDQWGRGGDGDVCREKIKRGVERKRKGLYANRGGDGNSILAFGDSGGASNKNQPNHD
jgi:hypothetical protein